MTETSTKTAINADKDAAMRAAYSAATKRLRESHREEFNTLQKEEAAKQGIDWSPKPTKEERALAEVQRLLDENPGLVDRLSQSAAPADTPMPSTTGL